MGISDHSQSAYYANGLSLEDIKRQHEEIDELNQIYNGRIRILKGIESDIQPDGSLDYPDEILASFDFVIASIHSGFNMDKETMTQRLLRAIENPYTTILGHPTGRLLLSREGYPLGYGSCIGAGCRTGVSLLKSTQIPIGWIWIGDGVAEPKSWRFCWLYARMPMILKA